MPKLTKNPCYYCGAPSKSKEHAPPKQMFKGFGCSSITVPSCDLHNSVKSSIDQAIVSAFLIPLYNGISIYNLESDIRTAVNQAQSAFQFVKRKAFSASVISNLTNSTTTSNLPEVSYLIVDIYHWLRQLTAALVWDAVKYRDKGIKWEQIPVWSREWINRALVDKPTDKEFLDEWDNNTTIKTRLDSLDWVQGWSAHPKSYPPSIFDFELCFEAHEVLFKYVFYNRYWFYVVVEPSPDTIVALKNKVNRVGGRGVIYQQLRQSDEQRM